MNVLEASQGEIGEYFAAKTARADDENLAVFAEECLDLQRAQLEDMDG